MLSKKLEHDQQTFNLKKTECIDIRNYCIILYTSENDSFHY